MCNVSDAQTDEIASAKLTCHFCVFPLTLISGRAIFLRIVRIPANTFLQFSLKLRQ